MFELTYSLLGCSLRLFGICYWAPLAQISLHSGTCIFLWVVNSLPSSQMLEPQAALLEFSPHVFHGKILILARQSLEGQEICAEDSNLSWVHQENKGVSLLVFPSSRFPRHCMYAYKIVSGSLIQFSSCVHLFFGCQKVQK